MDPGVPVLFPAVAAPKQEMFIMPVTERFILPKAKLVIPSLATLLPTLQLYTLL
jgi:hypothetical protein